MQADFFQCYSIVVPEHFIGNMFISQTLLANSHFVGLKNGVVEPASTLRTKHAVDQSQDNLAKLWSVNFVRQQKMLLPFFLFAVCDIFSP
jgi:hypothetical protein